MLALFLLASQTGLEAKSRQDDLKDRDHDAEERDHEKKKDGKHRHYSRYKKHKKHRHPHSIRVELESINKAIADIQTEIAALGQTGGGLPVDLTAKLAALQSAIDANTGELGVVDGNITDIILDIQGINDSLIANGRVRLADLESAVSTLESELDALVLEVGTLSGGTPTDLVFKGNFIQGNAERPRFGIKFDWANFKANATGSFSSIEIKNDLGGSVKCSKTEAFPTIATDIANELNTHFPLPGSIMSFNCLSEFTVNSVVMLQDVKWNIGDCNGAVELNADLLNEAVCGVGDGAVVRPLHPTTQNWGGVGTEFGGSGGTSGAPSQILEVILTR